MAGPEYPRIYSENPVWEVRPVDCTDRGYPFEGHEHAYIAKRDAVFAGLAALLQGEKP